MTGVQTCALPIYKSLLGYTPEGERAGRNGAISVTTEPNESVAGWMETFYHRVPLLDPEIRRMGFGQAAHPTRGWVTVLEPAR